MVIIQRLNTGAFIRKTSSKFGAFAHLNCTSVWYQLLIGHSKSSLIANGKVIFYTQDLIVTNQQPVPRKCSKLLKAAPRGIPSIGGTAASVFVLIVSNKVYKGCYLFPPNTSTFCFLMRYLSSLLQQYQNYQKNREFSFYQI